MMRWSVIAAVARAEMRLDRRLVRYWVFLIIAAGFWILSHVGLSVLFKNFSAVSATVSALNPRYIVAAIGMRYAIVMMLGIVFLAYDVRARDMKERIYEVLDSLPYSNLELLAGRCLGILVGIWVPAAVIVIGISTVSWFFGMPVEPLSIVSWLVLLMIPGMVFTIGLTFLLTLVARNRGVSAVLLLVVLGGLLAIMLRVPVWISPLADVLGVLMAGFPSDILPSVGTPDVFVQRFAILLMGFSLIVLAAAVHPRKDDGSASRRGMLGAAGIVIGMLALAWVVQLRVGLLDDLERWREVHAAHAAEPGPDVRSIRGTVDIDPGSRLDLELELAYVPVAGGERGTTRFTWNPGLEITAIEDASGTPVAFTHEDGLLEIGTPPAVGADGEVRLRMVATGAPDGDFAYLDAEIHPFEVGAWDAQIFLLGFESSVFESRFVGLMPGISWLPTSGAMPVGEAARDRVTDFFRLDLTVRLPEDWTAVVAGTRTEGEGGAQRFAPEVPVPPVALFASDFERRAVDIDGVVVEALLHRKHAAAFETFEESSGEIETWLRERLEDASDVGLDYPLGTLSMVEVPQSLRGFGGGWRMPTTMAPPGAVLVKESGFPTADFASRFEDRDAYEDREGGIARAKVEQLETFFENDFIGANPFVGGARSFFAHQTEGSGPEGLPLDYVFQGMTARLVADARGYFSVYIINSGMNDVIGNTIRRYMQDRSQLNVVDALVDVVASRPSVWDRLLHVSLIDLEPEEDPKETIDVLALKGDAMAQSMLDDLGRETSGRFLAALLERTRGREFTRADVLEAGRQVGVDLEPWLEVWLEQTSLPGFRLASIDAFRLADADDGSPRYQTLVKLANEESVGGLVTVEVLSPVPDAEDERSTQGPFRVDGESAVEVGVVSSRTPRSVRVEPYLSLNRGPFATPIDAVIDEDAIRDDEPFRGARPAVWTPPDSEHVVIDDLDDGFSVRASEGGSGMRLAGRERDDIETDGGVPVHGGGRVGKTFVRFDVQSAHGRYRHTVAGARPGPTGEAGVFTSDAERSGPWRLELHLPEGSSGAPAFAQSLKNWTVVIEDASGSNEVAFDAGDAAAGWNDLGTFEVATGELRVVLRGADKDALVIADAIRWTPPKRPEPSPAAGAQP